MKPTVTAGFPSSFPYLKHKLTHIQFTECNYLCLVFLQLQLHVKKINPKYCDYTELSRSQNNKYIILP